MSRRHESLVLACAWASRGRAAERQDGEEHGFGAEEGHESAGAVHEVSWYRSSEMSEAGEHGQWIFS